VPQGAALKVDGQDQGVTPKLVELTVGKHELQFSREGFSGGRFPLEVAPDDASGGSVTYELSTAAHDMVELRDGTVLMGDVQEVNATSIRITIGGADQTIDRNKVKRILLIEREPPRQQ
jgi:hypothetical protein